MPQPEVTTRIDDEKRPLDRELAELRKEVIESRNLVIKTDNLLKNLFAELKQVSKKADDQYRRTWFASGAAYLVFAGAALGLGLLGVRASLASERARVETSQAEADAAKKRFEELNTQVTRAKQESDADKAASDKAIAVYRMLSEGDGEARLRGVDELAKLERTRLNSLELKALDERAKTLKVELGQNAFDRGTKAFRREDWRATSQELKRYLSLDGEGADSLQAAFMLGSALFNLKDWPGAQPHLERFVTGARGQKHADTASFLLGQVHEYQGRFDKAMEAYRKGVADYPGSELVPAMQQRFRIAQVGALKVQPAAPAPATPTPGQARPAPMPPAPVPAPATPPGAPNLAQPAPARP